MGAWGYNGRDSLDLRCPWLFFLFWKANQWIQGEADQERKRLLNIFRWSLFALAMMISAIAVLYGYLHNFF